MTNLDEAMACYRQALAYHEQGNLSAATALYQRVIQLQPDYADAHNNLANALQAQGDFDQAVVHYNVAIQIKPDSAELRNNLGVALTEQGRFDDAVTQCLEALRRRPDLAAVHNSLANALLGQGHDEKAIAHFHDALRLQPAIPEVHNSLGRALWNQGKLDQALVQLYEAVRLSPDYAGAHNNLANALLASGRPMDAFSHLQLALQLQPDVPETRYNMALLRLLLGDFERGWPEYEWRWWQPRLPRRSFAQPIWDGSPLGSKTILLHAELGLGDTLHFIRYASLVKQRGGKVIVECQPPLIRLLRGCKDIDDLVARGSPLPAFDVHIPMLSVPGIMRTGIATIPAAMPYLQPDPALVAKWRCDLAAVAGFKVGIAWQGNPLFRADRFRSIPLSEFAALGDVPGVRLISLQKGHGADQLTALRSQFSVIDLGAGLDEASGPFMDTAAVIKNVDLVIACDSAVAHLAGALGCPVWVALALAPDWRWQLQRHDSPWYPTMRLFRQSQYAQWGDVFEQMARELKCLPTL